MVTKRYQKEGLDGIKSPHASSYLERVDQIREETARTQMEHPGLDPTQDPRLLNPQQSFLNRRLASHASLNKKEGIEANTLVISPSG